MIDCSQLHDFHPLDTGLTQDIQALLFRSHQRRRPCEREAFLALLAGVPALRKTPGLLSPKAFGPGYFTTLPRCASKTDTRACREHLRAAFGIRDQESLLAFCNDQFHCQENYLDLEAVWEGRPSAEVHTLSPDGLRWFQSLRDFSAQFYPLVGHQGYLAWDISESMGILRLGLACGLLSQNDFDALAEHFILQAQCFHSWEEYAASLVCGALYWDFRQGASLEELQTAKQMWMDLVRTLLANDAAWDSGLWYTPEQKKHYRLWPSEIKRYLPDWAGPNGCFVTDRVSVDGRKVGWCYREEPDPGFPDSGWRFFSGDEGEEYDVVSHTEIVDLNTVCNYDPEIVPLLSAPYNSAFVRDEETGQFRPEPFDLPEN